MQTLAAAGIGRLSAAPSTGLRIGVSEIQAQLEALSVFGRPAAGAFQDGVSRIGYSDAGIAGRQFVMDLMRKAGAEVRIDAAGNIFASRKGSQQSLPPVLFGSHIDWVPSGATSMGTSVLFRRCRFSGFSTMPGSQPSGR